MLKQFTLPPTGRRQPPRSGEPLDLRGPGHRLLVPGRARLEIVELNFQLVEKALLALRTPAILQEMEREEEFRTVPSWRVHRLRGDRRGTWSLSVSDMLDTLEATVRRAEGEIEGDLEQEAEVAATTAIIDHLRDILFLDGTSGRPSS